jgi:uncharacterized protein (DUF2336 family)
MSRLQDLIALAHEPSPERRGALLRAVTDLFFEDDDQPPGQVAMFDHLMVQLTADMEQAVRAELSIRLAGSRMPPPPSIARHLAGDEIAVAAPMLASSTALSDEDLLEVARTRGQDHLRAIAGRTTVPSAVSDVIVERSDDATLAVLLRNGGAALSRDAHEAAVDRAAQNPQLHEAVVSRTTLPIDLLNDMYFTVEARLRQQILQRNASIDPDELDAALKAGRQRVAVRDGALPSDYAGSERAVRMLKATGGFEPPALAGMLRAKQTTRFLICLAEMADIDFHTASRIIEKAELDMLAVVCRAADFDRALFLTLVMLIVDTSPNAMGKAGKYGDLYTALPADTARRTVQFWKTRRQGGKVAA